MLHHGKPRCRVGGPLFMILPFRTDRQGTAPAFQLERQKFCLLTLICIALGPIWSLGWLVLHGARSTRLKFRRYGAARFYLHFPMTAPWGGDESQVGQNCLYVQHFVGLHTPVAQTCRGTLRLLAGHTCVLSTGCRVLVHLGPIWGSP